QKLDTSASIWSQKDTFNNTGFNWKQGGLAKDILNITEPTNTVKLSKFNIKMDQDSIENMQVKINGTSYTVFADETEFNNSSLKNKVLIVSDGTTEPTLTFSEPLAKGSNVTVDYFIEGFSQEITVPKPSETETNPNVSFQLSKSALSTEGMPINVVAKNGVETSYTPVYSSNEWESLADKSGHVFVDLETGNLTFPAPLEEGDVIKADYKQNYFSFGLETFNENGESVKEKFSVEGSSSFTSIMNHISSSSVGVNAFYDDFTGQVTLTRSKTGNFNTNGEEIKVSGDFLNNVLGFQGSTETGGQNAKFVINGLETERLSNNFTI